MQKATALLLRHCWGSGAALTCVSSAMPSRSTTVWKAGCRPASSMSCCRAACRRQHGSCGFKRVSGCPCLNLKLFLLMEPQICCRVGIPDPARALHALSQLAPSLLPERPPISPAPAHLPLAPQQVRDARQHKHVAAAQQRKGGHLAPVLLNQRHLAACRGGRSSAVAAVTGGDHGKWEGAGCSGQSCSARTQNPVQTLT